MRFLGEAPTSSSQPLTATTAKPMSAASCSRVCVPVEESDRTARAPSAPLALVPQGLMFQAIEVHWRREIDRSSSRTTAADGFDEPVALPPCIVMSVEVASFTRLIRHIEKTFRPVAFDPVNDPDVVSPKIRFNVSVERQAILQRSKHHHRVMRRERVIQGLGRGFEIAGKANI